MGGGGGGGERWAVHGREGGVHKGAPSRSYTVSALARL